MAGAKRNITTGSTGDWQQRRAYIRKLFADRGADALNDNELLELLLYYTIPDFDTSEIAKNLLKEFGSLSGVIDADPYQLTDVPGIGQDAALFLFLLRQFYRRYCIDKKTELPFIATRDDAKKYLESYFLGETEELLIVLLLDGCSCLRKVSIIDRGNEESVSVNVNRIFREVLNTHASSVLLAHSHPNGFARPSRDDIAVTLELAKRLNTVGVGFCDHLIFARNDVCCMSDEKKLLDNHIFLFADSTHTESDGISF